MKNSVKALFLGVVSLLGSSVWADSALSEEDIRYLPELRSAAWSPDLTKEDIRKIRFAIYRLAQLDHKDYARQVLAPYIEDKRNLEVRYIYALAIAEQELDRALDILKELSIAGYPNALFSYGEERVCQLKPYQEACQQHDFYREVYSRLVNWTAEDPLAGEWHYFSGVLRAPDVTEDSEYFKAPPEAVSFWQQGAEAGSFYSAKALYYYYQGMVKQGDNSKQPQAGFYKTEAKRLIHESPEWNDISPILPSDSCYPEYQKKLYRENTPPAADGYDFCLNEAEHRQLLIGLAKQGNLAAIEKLTMRLYLRPGYKYKFYNYIRFEGSNRDIYPADLATLYDKLIEANNGRGWGYLGYIDHRTWLYE